MKKKIFHKTTLMFAATFLCLVGFIESEAQKPRPYLVKIPRTDRAETSLLQDLGIRVNLKLEEWYIAEVGETDLKDLNAAGVEYDILDETAWSQPYYLVNKPRRAEFGDIPEIGRVVFRDHGEALIKVDDEEALKLGRHGFLLTRIFQKPLPLLEPEAKRQKPIHFEPLEGDVIGAIVNQVSQAIVQSYVQRLQDFRTRYFSTDSIKASAQWIYDRFVEYGYTDVVFDTLAEPANGVTVWNVIATKPGTLNPDSVFIIGGHYDSIVHDGTDATIWAPGADDDASGVVAAMEAARILANIDLDYTVKFACWTAEEIGLYGSWDYANKARAQEEKIGLYINFDMIGNLDVNDPLRDIDIGTNPASQVYADLMADMARQYTTLVPFQFNAHGGSDHYPFMQNDFNFVYGAEGDFSPHWHKFTDTIDNMDIPYMCEVVKMGLATLVTVAGPPESFPDPLIAFEDLIMDDDAQGGSVGNGNGYFDPGETIEISLLLRNFGDTKANGVSGRLQSDDPYVTVLDEMGSFGDIPSDGTGISEVQYRFVISENAPNGRNINFSLEATASGGYEWTTFFSVRVMQPEMIYNTFKYEEVVGDGNGILDPGESVSLYLNLGNAGLRSASGIITELETDDPDIVMTDHQALFPDMNVSANTENGGDPFTFSLEETAAPHAIPFTLHVSEGEGYFQTELPFRVLIGQGRVLLVVDDGGVDNSEFYIEALKHMGVMYDQWATETRGKIALDSLSDYGEVIWFTGAIGTETLTDQDQTVLADYLDRGGHLFLSGNLIGFDIGTTSFYSDYLHAYYIHFFSRLHHLQGPPANPVTRDMGITLAVTGENGQAFTGETDPLLPAFSILNYDRTTDEGPGDIRSSGSGALAFENEQYKLVYFSFGFEGIEPFEDRAALLSNILSWFQAPVALRGDMNGDGQINVLDVVLVIRIVIGTYVPTSEELERSDINYDGDVDVLDVTGIVQRILEGSGSSGQEAGLFPLQSRFH